jgi:hypothetical protein
MKTSRATITGHLDIIILDDVDESGAGYENYDSWRSRRLAFIRTAIVPFWFKS